MLLLGALLILAFPAPNLEFLAWFGLVPGLVLIVRSPTAREGGMRAWWLGAGYLIAALYWMAPEIGPAVLLVGAVVGALWIPFGVAAAKLLRPPVTWPRALAALVVVPSCWLLTEWLRSWQALGGPWAVFGVSQWQHPAVLALAAVGGVWLVSFALVMVNVAIVLVLESLPRVTPGANVRPGLAVLGAAVAVAGVGAGPLAFALTPASPRGPRGDDRHGAAGDRRQREPAVDASEAADRRAEPRRRAERGQAGPDRLGREQHPRWTSPCRRTAPSCARWSRWPREDGADMLVSQDATVPGKGHEKWSVLVSPTGIRGMYIKTRLVPFGEYIPFRQQLGWLTKISRAAASNMIPGTGAHLLYPVDRAGKPLPIGVLICFESAFPDMSRVDTDQGAAAHRLPVGDVHLPGHLGTGPARLAQRGARGRDRPARGAGRADRGHGGVRR